MVLKYRNILKLAGFIAKIIYCPKSPFDPDLTQVYKILEGWDHNKGQLKEDLKIYRDSKKSSKKQKKWGGV